MTTALAAALAASYRRVNGGPVEAGLRIWNKYYPFAEEISRKIVVRISDFDFAPTETARQNLLREGIADQSIRMTGNMVIDALPSNWRASKIARLPIDSPDIRGILVTARRRENFGAPLENIGNREKRKMQRLTAQKGTFFKLLYLALTLLPFLCLIFMVYRYYVDVLVWDAWELVPFLDKFYQGTLSLQDLWAPRNGHRPFFPRIVLFLLERFSGWNMTYELAFIILLTIVIFFVLVYQIRITERLLQVQLKWLIPVLSIMIFSLSQAETWLYGIQIPEPMNVLAVVAGFVLLQTPNNWAKYSAAILLGVIASYSFGNGLLYWFIGLFILLVLTFDNRRLMISRVAIWVVAAGLTILLYTYDYPTSTLGLATFFAFSKPLESIEYVLVFLGTPVTPTSFDCYMHGINCELGIFAAIVASLSGLILFGYVTWSLWRQVELKTLTPYVGMALYAILSALVADLTRSIFGVAQAMSSRYITFSSLFWIALAVFLLVLAKTTEMSNKRRRRAGYLLVILMAGLVTLNSIQWSGFFVATYEYYSPLRTGLLLQENDNVLKLLYPWAPSLDWMKTQREVLQKYHLSVFRGQ